MFRQRITALLIVLLVCGLAVPAQTPAPAIAEKVDVEMMSKIRKEGMENSKVMDTLSWMTDVIGPRLTGSPQLKHANEWTKTRLTEWGLENAHLEAWGPFGRGWSLEKFSANVTAPVPFPIIGYPKAWTPGTNGAITGEVVYFDVKTEADFEKYRGKLKDAIVLSVPMREVKAWFNAPGSRYTDVELLAMANAAPPGGGGPRQGGPAGTPNQEQMQRFRDQRAVAQKRADFLRAEGAAVLVDIGRNGDGGTVFVASGGPRDKNAPQALPSITVTVEHYGRMVRMLEKGVNVKMEVDIKAKFHDDDPMAYNTVAEIPGTDLKDEVVMLGGHLDSWHGGTGATDNAAGCSVGMEAVRILKTLGVKPRRTIRIALWSGEEQGLFGSRAYVSQHFAERKAVPGQQAPANDPLAGMGGPQGPLVLKPEHDKFSAYFNLDNGTGKVRGIYLQGNEAVRPIFRAWLEPFRDLGASTITSSNTGGTDHQAFDGVGLPGFQFIQDEVEYSTRTHHSNMDMYDRIQADDMKQASVIMAAFVYNAAMRDEKLPRKPLPANVEKPVAAVTAPTPDAAKNAAGKANSVTNKKAAAAKGKQ